MKQLLFVLIAAISLPTWAQQGQDTPVPVRVYDGVFKPSQVIEPSHVTHFKAFDMRVNAQVEAAKALQNQGYTCEYKTSIHRQCRKTQSVNTLPPRVIQGILRRIGTSSSISFAPPHDISGTLINNSPLLKVWRLQNTVWLNNTLFRFYDIALTANSAKLIFREPNEKYISEAVITNDPQLLKVYYAQPLEVGTYEYYVYGTYVRYHRVK